MPYDQAILQLSTDPREMKLVLPKNLYAHIYSNFIHNYQKLEATHMSFNWWTDKLRYMHAMQ